jgi:cell division transport system permease protein
VALKVDYVARETSTNLWRNITLTIAAIVTIAVSLGLFGSALLMQGAVGNLTSRWSDDVQVAVFLDRDVTDEQFDALETSIASHPEVERFEYFDVDDSREEFERLFERSSSMMAWLNENPEGLPTSFRIVPATLERGVVEALTDSFVDEPGVLRSTSALEGADAVSSLSSSASTGFFVTAVGLLIAAILLILNAIRMAMYARRREIEVMKLVGATNWFIRVPFMMEGVVQGLAGAFLAVGGIKLVDSFMARAGAAEPGAETTILSGFVAPSGTVVWVMILTVFLGMIIGAIGSGIAVSRFLRV